MLGLPVSTELDKRIPKNVLYERADVNTQTKRAIVDQVDSIYWVNKLGPENINLATGDTVNEIEVFHVVLKQKSIDLDVLVTIDKAIPYYIIFVLEYRDKIQLRVSYKEVNENTGKVKPVGKYYQTEWLARDVFKLTITGLDLDAVFSGFVHQIAGEQLSETSANVSLKENIERDTKRLLLEKKINAIKAKIKKERQFNKKVELNAEVKKLKKELEALHG